MNRPSRVLIILSLVCLPGYLQAREYWWVLSRAWTADMGEKTPLFLLDTRGRIVTKLACPLQNTVGVDLVPLDPKGRLAGLLVARPGSWHPPLRYVLGPFHRAQRHELWLFDTCSGLPTGQLRWWWWQVDIALTVPAARRVCVEKVEPDRYAPEVVEFSRRWRVRLRPAYSIGYSAAISPDGARLWDSFEANHIGGLPRVGGVRELDARTGQVLHEEVFPGPDWCASHTVRTQAGQVYTEGYYSKDSKTPTKSTYFAWKPGAKALTRLPFARQGFLVGFSDRYGAFITTETTKLPARPGHPEPHWRDWRFRHDIILMSARTGKILRRICVANNTPEIGGLLRLVMQLDGGRRLMLLCQPGMRGQPGLLAIVDLDTRQVTRVVFPHAQPLAVVAAELSSRDLARIKRLARHLQEIGRRQAKPQS